MSQFNWGNFICSRNSKPMQNSLTLKNAMNKLLTIAVAIGFLFLGHLVEAQVPQILNYQGRVAVNGTNFDGTGQFQFAFVDGTGTVTYWSNGNSIVSLPVSAGLYSVFLGDTNVSNMAAIPTTVFTNTDVRLRVWFNSGAGLQQLNPDQRFTAVGFALMAANVPNGAITSANIANGAVGTSQLASNAVTSANIASNTITAANMAPGAGVVPSGAFVLSQTASNASLTAAGFTPFTTNFFLYPGANWTEVTATAPWSGRSYEAAVGFKNQMWVLGGYNSSSYFNDVWTSTDGTNWTEVTAAAPWSPRSELAAVAFNGQMWLLGGFNGSDRLNDVWSSPNGVNWAEAIAAPWSSRTGVGAVAFNGRLWVMGGDNPTRFNDVWSSPDGTNWTQVTTAAPWSGRSFFAAVVFNGQIWVMGGSTLSSNLNDVWSSPDGTNWTEVTAAAPWSARAQFGSVVFNGQMEVLGGNSGGGNDVWSSPDGTNWTEVTSAAQWSARAQFGSVVFNNQMWVFGGYNGSSYFNDVWSSTGATTTNNVPVQLGQFYLFQKQ
jgi:hypothetical protein